MSRRELRAAEYRQLASDADALAASSALPNVREKHRRAAAQWTALALLNEPAGEPDAARDAHPLAPPIQKEAPCIG